jgi:hypothetical protein
MLGESALIRMVNAGSSAELAMNNSLPGRGKRASSSSGAMAKAAGANAEERRENISDRH